jgi:general secretion pathway protein F
LRYKYQVLDRQQQEISGTIDAANEREATRLLQRRELTVIHIEAFKNKSTHTANRKPKPRDTWAIMHELITLLESGVSLIEAVKSLAESSHHSHLTQAFSQIAMKLRQGGNFSSALKESSLELPWYVSQLAQAGELTGKLAPALRDGLQQMEYDTRIKNEMRNALVYPTILVVSGIIAVLLIFTLVVPKFASILKNKNPDDIPFLAKAVLNTGMFLNNHFYEIAMGLGLLLIFIVYLFQNPHFQIKFREMLGRLPMLGEWLIESETGRWSAMLGTLIENRVALLRALELAAEGVQLPSLKSRLSLVSQHVKNGVTLSQALQDNDAITPTGHNLIRAGERAGELARMLKSLAQLYEETGRNRMKRLLLLIEPIAILVIGAVIGVIITGVILAITTVNQIKI